MRSISAQQFPEFGVDRSHQQPRRRMPPHTSSRSNRSHHPLRRAVQFRLRHLRVGAAQLQGGMRIAARHHRQRMDGGKFEALPVVSTKKGMGVVALQEINQVQDFQQLASFPGPWVVSGRTGEALPTRPPWSLTRWAVSSGVRLGGTSSSRKRPIISPCADLISSPTMTGNPPFSLASRPPRMLSWSVMATMPSPPSRHRSSTDETGAAESCECRVWTCRSNSDRSRRHLEPTLLAVRTATT